MNGYLLDTQAFLDWVADSGRIGPAATAAIESGRVVASDVTLWEASIKIAIGKLQVSGEVGSWFDEQTRLNGFSPLALARAHAARVAALPLHHRDPFDRLLIAQAQIEGLTLVGRDRKFAAYEVDVLDTRR